MLERIGIIMDELWKKAQGLAAKRYEEEGRNWDDADKYEKEDYVYCEYFKLKKLLEGGE